MDVDLNEVLQEAANENNRLKDQLEALQDEVERTRNGSRQHEAERIVSGALCKGCYKYRLFFAALFGLTGAVFASRTLHPRHALLRMIGNENAANWALIGLVLLTAAAPVLATVAEWKWMQFKHGAGSK